MITSMHIENFKCFKDFDINLGPFNVLIGPNDTGKTALLQAVRLAGAFQPKQTVNVSMTVPEIGFDIGGAFRQEEPNEAIQITVGADMPPEVPDGVRLLVTCRRAPRPNSGHAVWSSNLDTQSLGGVDLEGEGTPDSILPAAFDAFTRDLCDSAYYALDPRQLRKPCQNTVVLSETGEGLPALLASILRMDRERFLALEKHFYRRFPSYKRLELPLARVQVEGDGVSLCFVTSQSQVLQATSVSDGVMLSLAYLALCYQLTPPSLLLIEEPETGVHHASLKDIIETLKHLSDKKGVQIILTTHSPYLLDHVEADQVHVFTKDPEGAVHAKRLSEFEDVADMKSHFMPGEIWSILAEAHNI